MLALALAGLLASSATPEVRAGGSLRIGNKKQLFIDDFIIASRDNFTRILHHPKRFPGNPVLTGNEPWEKHEVYLNGRGLLYDEDTREFKMWYEIIYPIYSETGRAKIGSLCSAYHGA